MKRLTISMAMLAAACGDNRNSPDAKSDEPSDALGDSSQDSSTDALEDLRTIDASSIDSRVVDAQPDAPEMIACTFSIIRFPPDGVDVGLMPRCPTDLRIDAEVTVVDDAGGHLRFADGFRCGIRRVVNFSSSRGISSEPTATVFDPVTRAAVPCAKEDTSP
jgi:hypothetical protein